jgi:hypothetical protein
MVQCVQLRAFGWIAYLWLACLLARLGMSSLRPQTVFGYAVPKILYARYFDALQCWPCAASMFNAYRWGASCPAVSFWLA